MIQKVVPMNDESDEVLREATMLCDDEREEEAELLILEQLTSYPDNLALMTKLGVIQARLCKDQEAESSFRAVLGKAPGYEDVICGLGRLLDQSLRTEEAEKLYRDFLQYNPVGHCALEDLCRILLSEDRSDEALELARTHTEQYGTNPNAFVARRFVLQILEDQLEAELNDDRENNILFSQLIDNLLEQLELVITMMGRFESQEDLNSELNDDKTRILSELEYLVQSAPSRQISVPDEIQKRITSIDI